jgi:cell division protein FtsN
MRDYKESIPRGAPRGQKRSQLKRLFGIMGGMVFTFAIFVVGVKVGIQIERERVRIAQEAPAPIATSKEKEDTDRSARDKSSLPPAKKDEGMRFTFYETLTRKEGVEKEQQKGKEQPAKKEQAKVMEKKGETKTPPPKTAKVEETKKTPAPKDLYFVQVASFNEEATAEGLKGRLIKKGYAVQVVPVQIEKMGLWYRVRLGGYATLQEAQAAQKKVSFEENIEGTKVVSGP